MHFSVCQVVAWVEKRGMPTTHQNIGVETLVLATKQLVPKQCNHLEGNKCRENKECEHIGSHSDVKCQCLRNRIQARGYGFIIQRPEKASNVQISILPGMRCVCEGL